MGNLLPVEGFGEEQKRIETLVLENGGRRVYDKLLHLGTS